MRYHEGKQKMEKAGRKNTLSTKAIAQSFVNRENKG